MILVSITGEEGVGKTALMAILQKIAERKKRYVHTFDFSQPKQCQDQEMGIHARTGDIVLCEHLERARMSVDISKYPQKYLIYISTHKEVVEKRKKQQENIKQKSFADYLHPQGVGGKVMRRVAAHGLDAHGFIVNDTAPQNLVLSAHIFYNAWLEPKLLTRSS